MTKSFLRRANKKLEAELVNAKQAARAAAQHIEELEHQIMLNIRDIRLYVQCIHGMINHGSPCEYCEDRDECEINGKNIDAGCDEWMLTLWRPGEEVKDWQEQVMAGNKQTELFAEGGPEDGHQEKDGTDNPEGADVPGGQATDVEGV